MLKCYFLNPDKCKANDSEKCKKGDVQCTKGESCFVSWTNTSGQVKNVLAGCWITPTTQCEGHECKAEFHKHTRGYHFCCCSRPMCNKNYSLILEGPTTTTHSPAHRSGPPHADSGAHLWPYIIPVAVVLVVLLVVILVICLVYRKHRNRRRESGFEIEPLFRPVEMLELKARGRFGDVWKARMQGELVAVKKFRFDEKLSWQREQELYTQLLGGNHENILRFICAEKRGGPDEEDQEFWLITEYHQHGSLHDYLQGHVVSWDELRVIGITMTSGLAFLHDSPVGPPPRKPCIAHRDLKSKNVLLKSDLTACIADFGLAKPFEPGKPVGQCTQVGTQRYMAPEVIMGSIEYNIEQYLKIDMYACGLILWELLTRCNEFEEITYQQPFEAEFLEHPSLGEDVKMKVLVVDRKVRPKIRDCWLQHPGTRELVKTVEECLDHDSECRPAAGLANERIKDLPTSDSQLEDFGTVIVDSAETQQLLLGEDQSNGTVPAVVADKTM